jgi:hypothetical protein
LSKVDVSGVYRHITGRTRQMMMMMMMMMIIIIITRDQGVWER